MPRDRKEYFKEYSKQWRKNNPEYFKEYRENNKEYKKEWDKEYNQTPAGIKRRRISDWKRYEGMSQDYNWDEIYDIYIDCKVCDYCDVELVEGMYGSNKKCLDHHHITGEIRGILCNTCNLNEVLA